MLKLLEHMTFAFYTPNDKKSNVETMGKGDGYLLHTKQ